MTDILIAFADTGGGHRAAAESIRRALLAGGDDVRVVMADPYAEQARWPFSQIGGAYPVVVRHLPWLWEAGFRLTNRPRVVRAVQRAAWPVLRRGFDALGATHTPDVIVCTHPLLTAPLRRTYPQVPIIVVVTDLISGHVSWYDSGADLVVVPTPEARDAAIAAGIPREQVHVIGIPVAPAFVAQPGERRDLLARLGWAEDRATILLAGGAEGIGGLEAFTVAIDRAGLPCDVAVVAGRNHALAARLRARSWHGTVRVYDFVDNFADLVRAASALLTKAGPGTISEACASGCPLILTSAIAGQETGNIAFVTRGRAGVWAPSPLAATAALQAWLVGRDAPAALQRASRAALSLARPHAASQIAALVREAAHAAAASTALPSTDAAAA
ncbi:MAG: glycosyltransferase [Gemmatimonadota bacterium]